MSTGKRPRLDEALDRLVTGMLDGFKRFMAEEWPRTTDIREMVRWAERPPLYLGERKLRLFAVACCRRVWHLLPASATRRLVEACERHADGLATAEEMHEAMHRACPYPYFRRRTPRTLAREAARSAVGQWELSFSSAKAGAAICAASYAAEAVGLVRPGGEEDERQAQADLLRDIVGDPLNPARADPVWLRWNGGAVIRLARTIYEGRRFEDMPVLADALEDAGCEDAGLLGHLRGPRPHVRGCFALDLLTGKG